MQFQNKRFLNLKSSFAHVSELMLEFLEGHIDEPSSLSAQAHLTNEGVFRVGSYTHNTRLPVRKPSCLKARETKFHDPAGDVVHSVVAWRDNQNARNITQLNTAPEPHPFVVALGGCLEFCNDAHHPIQQILIVCFVVMQVLSIEQVPQGARFASAWRPL